MVGKSGTSKMARSEAKKRSRDLHGGMELLGLDFLLDIIENADDSDDYDLTMRKLSFHELVRTDRLSNIDSYTLGCICMDEDGQFDKRMHCEAMQELTRRTEQSLGN